MTTRFRFPILPTIALAALCTSLAAAPAPAPIAITLHTPEGNALHLPAPDAEATVLVFVTPGCPMANRYAPALHALAEKHEGRVKFYRVYADPAITPEAVAAHESAYAYGFPALLDPDFQAVTATGATRTPEIAVLDAEGALRYRGAVDDRFTDFGKYRQAATKPYLEDALEAIHDGKPLAITRTDVVGCFIPSKDTTQHKDTAR